MLNIFNININFCNEKVKLYIISKIFSYKKVVDFTFFKDIILIKMIG